MDRCDYCGEGCDLTHQCSYCEADHCPDHRLPERHDCIGQHAMGSDAPLGTGGPETDRRSTYTQRIDRVRETETETWETKVDPDAKEAGDGGGTTAVLTCPICGSATDQLRDCPGCDQKYCGDCQRPQDHDCAASGGRAGSGGSRASSWVEWLRNLFS